MKITKKDYYLDFITKNITVKPNNIISANKIYTLFCSIYDINPKTFDIKAFTPNFTKAYKLIYNEPIKKTFRRINIGENPITCFLDVSLHYFESTVTLNKQAINIKDTLNEQDKNAIIINKPIKIDKIEKQATVYDVSIPSVITVNGVDITEFVDYFGPGTKDDPIILTKDFLTLYSEIYKESEEHKQLIPYDSKFKEIFKQAWDKKHPNNELKEARKNNSRGYKFIKRIK